MANVVWFRYRMFRYGVAMLQATRVIPGELHVGWPGLSE